jgi:molybdopterin-containing oxidoreductase family iron-sulfur binding subunit
MVFGDLRDKNSRVVELSEDDRHFTVLEHLGTAPSIIYLKQVDVDA